jgi:beta-glucosidase
VAKSSTGYTVSVPLANRSRIAGDEVIQIYAAYQHPLPSDPIRKLVAFKHINLGAGEKRIVQVEVTNWAMRSWNESRHAYEVRSDGYTLEIGPYSGKVQSTVHLKVE